MLTIDFNTLPEDKKKNLSQNEINLLNELFADPIIRQQLEDIEEQRKIRQKWEYIVYGGSTIITLIFSFTFGTGDGIFSRLLSGFLYTIGTGDTISYPIIYLTISLYGIGIGYLYKKFSSKIEIPLKTEVLKKMCPILYSKFKYSHDSKYSFDELDYLISKQFLNSYNTINTVEDSIYFEMENNGKLFSVNSFELRTSITNSANKQKVKTTNHCYLMRAVFPNARIPLQSDLYITQNKSDGGTNQMYLLPIAIFFIITFFSYVIFVAITASTDNAILTSMLIGGFLASASYNSNIKNINKSHVQLENMEFEKLFDVKCEDQVTSRMIITPAFMDRIVSFVNKTGNEYEFLMQDNIMYIKRRIYGGYMEIGTGKNILNNLEGFAKMYTDMREIIQFTYNMNLLYLSKTDTTKTIETEENIVHIDPIRLTK